jgi:hypothetical protein
LSFASVVIVLKGKAQLFCFCHFSHNYLVMKSRQGQSAHEALRARARTLLLAEKACQPN